MLVLASVLAGCIPESHAQPLTPAPVVAEASPKAALDAYRARREALRARAHVPVVDAAKPESACAPDEVLWKRDATSAFCAVRCTTDDDCGLGERCRVLTDVGVGKFEDVMIDDWEGLPADVEAVCDPWPEPPAVEYPVDGVDAGT